MIENFIKSSEYTQKLFQIDDEVLKNIEMESLNDNVPIITREVLNFMIFNAKGIGAKNILEVGTATGYSGLFLAQIANTQQLKLMKKDMKRLLKILKKPVFLKRII